MIITKTKPKPDDMTWLTANYQISYGALRIEIHSQGYGGIAADPEEIACHFVNWYAARIKESFPLALPF